MASETHDRQSRIVRKLASPEQDLQAEDGNLGQQGQRSTQAERVNLHLLARDLADLKRAIRQAFHRVTLLLAVIAAVYCALRAVHVVREKHAATSVWASEQELSIAQRFWQTVGSQQLSLVTVAAAAVAAILAFCAVWVIYYLLKWVLVGVHSPEDLRLSEGLQK